MIPMTRLFKMQYINKIKHQITVLNFVPDVFGNTKLMAIDVILVLSEGVCRLLQTSNGELRNNQRSKDIYCCQVLHHRCLEKSSISMAFIVNIESTQHEFQHISLVLIFDFQLVYTCCGKRKLSCNYTQLVLKKISGGNLLSIVRGCSSLVYSKANSFADIFKISRGYIYQRLMNSPIFSSKYFFCNISFQYLAETTVHVREFFFI